MRRLIPLLITTAALLAGGAAAASAQTPDVRPAVGVQDDRLLFRGGDTAAYAVSQWNAFGIDTVRINVRWDTIAPALTSKKPPKGFNAANPRDRRYSWHAVDNAVNAAARGGLRIQLTVTGPGPLWSSSKPSAGDPRFRPSPKKFAQFATAVAKRYGSDVDQYLVYNEPNQGGWLRPQFDCTKKCQPAAPHIYRALLAKAGPAIRKADPGAKLVIGELAPIARVGGGLNTTSPLPFLRAFACVDEKYRPIHTGDCKHFKAPSGDVFGYHPHGLQRAPDKPNPNKNDAQLADLDRLFGALDRLTKAKRLKPTTGKTFKVDFTEFGYQTSPPDFAIGISLADQARWIQQAAYITWENKRVVGLTHYQWEDEPVFWRSGSLTQAYNGWQTGLLYVTGAPKPALTVFAYPFVVDVVGSNRGRLWGQVRPGAAHGVRVFRSTDGATWTPIADLRTDAGGYWSLTTGLTRGATYGFAPADDPAALPVAPASGTVRVTNTTKRKATGANPPS